jgi:hypothetical protein
MSLTGSGSITAGSSQESVVIVAELPKLYSPRVPIIVLKTSDYCTREPDNSGSLSGVLEEPRIIHILQFIQDQ